MKPAFIPLAAGLQTELADQIVQPGSTLLHENMVHPQTGKARVRFGSDILSTATQATLPSGGTLPIPWQLATLGGSLVRFNRAPVPLHTWAETPEAYVAPAENGAGLISYRKGPLKIDATPVISQAQANESVLKPTVAVSGDVIVTVTQTRHATSNATTVSILDRATRRPLFTRQTASGTVTPRVAIVGTVAVVAYENGTNLIVDSYDLSTFAFSQTATLGTVITGTPIDIRVGAPGASAGNVGILYQTSGTSQLRCAVVLATNLATNSVITIQDTTPANVVPDLGFGWMQDLGSSGKFAIMVADTTNGVRVLWDIPAPTAGTSVAVRTDSIDGTATTIPTGGAAGVRNLIGSTVTSSTSGVYRVLFEFTAPAIPTKALIRHFVASAGVVTAEPTQIRSVGIRSKLWLHSTNMYFLGAWDGDDQRTYFVLAVSFSVTTGIASSAPHGVVLPRDAGGLTEATNSPTDVGVDSDGAIFIAATSELRTELIETAGAAGGGTSRSLAEELIRIRHAASVETELGRPAEFLRALFVPGGNMGHFDGQTYAAAGFPYYPPPVTLTAVAGGALTLTATYSYRALFSFVDRNGRKWRSAPSTPVQITLAGAEASVDVDVETLRLFDRGAIGTILVAGFQIELYRTQPNATEGYFQVAVFGNDPTSTTSDLTITDSVPDVSLGEQLYTDGGGVENQLLPPSAWCVEHQGRLVVGESGTGTIWYPVEADFTNGLIYNEALTLDVGDPSEPTTGAAVFNEQLFVFKAGKAYVVAGQYANALGQGQTLTARLIDGGVGCGNPQSIVVADDGVWFKSSGSRAGIHRTTGGSTEYVGQGVRAHDDLTISSGVVVRDATEIRWYTVEGTTLVWNWTTKLWGTNTAQPCLSATTGYAEAAGVVYARETDSAVMVESTTRYQEGFTAYTGKIRAPWYQGSGLAGWQRIKRLQGVGDAGAAHTAVIRLYKDMATAPFQTAELAFDGSAQRWNWEIRPSQQKASATMVEVEIAAPADVVITPDALDDEYLGANNWHLENTNFTAADLGGLITITGTPGGNYNGTFQITAILAADEVTMTPAPAGGAGLIAAATITLTRPLTAGPEILGVSLIPVSKEGMDKVPSSRRAT